MRLIGIAAIVCVVGSLTAAGVAQGTDEHDRDRGLRLTSVPANPKVAGLTVPNVLSPEWAQRVAAQGSNRLENGTADIPFYGYRGDGPLLPAPGDLPSATHKVEAQKTEPDKNTYLVLYGQHGADPHYNYGTHFLFQGHEAGATGYLTRINLDADGSFGCGVRRERGCQGRQGDPVQAPGERRVPSGHGLPRVRVHRDG